MSGMTFAGAGVRSRRDGHSSRASSTGCGPINRSVDGAWSHHRDAQPPGDLLAAAPLRSPRSLAPGVSGRVFPVAEPATRPAAGLRRDRPTDAAVPEPDSEGELRLLRVCQRAGCVHPRDCRPDRTVPGARSNTRADHAFSIGVSVVSRRTAMPPGLPDSCRSCARSSPRHRHAEP